MHLGSQRDIEMGLVDLELVDPSLLLIDKLMR